MRELTEVGVGTWQVTALQLCVKEQELQQALKQLQVTRTEGTPGCLCIPQS
jgi:hypothetical protein